MQNPIVEQKSETKIETQAKGEFPKSYDLDPSKFQNYKL